jgi:hypothetical protein
MPLGGVQDPAGRRRVLYFSTSSAHSLLRGATIAFGATISDTFQRVGNIL